MAVIYEISKAFNQHASEYEHAAKVQQEIGVRLLGRLQYLNIKPQRILDVGCGPGYFSNELTRIYPKAQVIGLDLAKFMLIQAQKKQSWRRKWPLVAADMRSMPFATGTFDLVFANQVIHWGGSLNLIFRELNRIMKPHGCLMFTTLGPDTFKELKQAWSGVNPYAHVNEFADMHDVGDSLVSEHFLDPVMDMEVLEVHYGSLSKLLHSLKAQGVKNINPQRNQGLTGKTAWRHFEQNYAALRTEQGKYPLSYEVVYGHAWKGEQRKTELGIETVIPISQIVRPKG
ncbi:malonyl-ACP O-methyltransferase BioC [Fluoribacter dumoffii]|uniref:Malonyl-[acyl-carrier protein] O-methyltransferase n=1 Tax=Fluoribacter dumoffii TaxID=463 RepID=A0A377G6Z5_9GAMM|nr:malonyl-ACP O-methyltransferase BioC [Fluoribacter dumoffii]KTC89394.1 biotin synthase BioC [Fluoribacter dumoffii NY 23]MCW8386809.1 malonyl-ACP O-methyltransferase BioC [Fluoribacter dumoffii]MCW8417656.1 malonyl-ACP O-methyltransferase BioC [Fluoribacter dumoffii]MCW8454502.1 malonyl-ACP O-methyltransferase BioC [Fluoribacter dumoffii]MCW8461424.1 malonyl-ACP O-methyltransferase BioC [Fluoribacter dumoffii]